MLIQKFVQEIGKTAVCAYTDTDNHYSNSFEREVTVLGTNTSSIIQYPIRHAGTRHFRIEHVPISLSFPAMSRRVFFQIFACTRYFCGCFLSFN